jgi:hypothetical protein
MSDFRYRWATDIILESFEIASSKDSKVSVRFHFVSLGFVETVRKVIK